MNDKNESITESNIDSKLASSNKLFLLDFWNESCVVCKRIAPMLEDLAETYADKLIFAKINADENPAIVDRFNIRGLPTLLFIKEGKILEKVSGVKMKSELSKIIADNI
jgi:thioredoxin 1